MDAEARGCPEPSLSAEDQRWLLSLARRTLQTCLCDADPPEYGAVAPHLLAPRATFVTLRRRRSGELRGCRGERVARRPLVESVIHMTIASALDDPRFAPVTLDEVPQLQIEISALRPPRPIGPEDVVVGRHGLIVSRGGSVGLLLPQVPGLYGWDREAFLAGVCEKAGLAREAWKSPSIRLEAFEAEVWEEEERHEPGG